MSETEFVLTDEEYERVMEASRPVPYLVIGGVEPMSPQENANRVWRAIYQDRGLDWKTVARGSSGPRSFRAVSL